MCERGVVRGAARSCRVVRLRLKVFIGELKLSPIGIAQATPATRRTSHKGLCFGARGSMVRLYPSLLLHCRTRPSSLRHCLSPPAVGITVLHRRRDVLKYMELCWRGAAVRWGPRSACRACLSAGRAGGGAGRGGGPGGGRGGGGGRPRRAVQAGAGRRRWSREDHVCEAPPHGRVREEIRWCVLSPPQPPARSLGPRCDPPAASPPR